MSALNATRLQRADHYFSDYAVVLPGADTLEDALKPEYWAHVAPKLRQGDTIRIIPEDDSYFAEALVRATGTGFAKLELLRHIPFDAAQTEAVPDTVEVKWGGPHDKWRVIRRSDGHVLARGLDKAAALRESLNYARLAA